MSCPCGTELERYLKSFVFAHTGENVDLHLRTGIEISHATKKGHTLLAVLWANVLQHEKNFPSNKYIYTQAHDEASNADVLILSIEEIQLMVFMRTGKLTIDGLYVFEWFVKRFQRILENFDPAFAMVWEDQPKGKEKCQVENSLKASNKKQSVNRTRSSKQCRSATEEYLLLLTDRHTYTEGHRKKIMDDSVQIEAQMSRMSLTQHLWKGSALSHEASLLSSGGLRDGYNHIYKLWRSFLREWFNTKGTRVFLCSPCLDERCLSDIIDLFLSLSTTANIVSFFTQRKCRDATSDNQNSFFHMKRKVLEKYPKTTHSLIEYRIYKSLLCPSARFNCKFIAGVKDGTAQVMITSADFNMDHFVSANMEFVSVVTMSEKTFMEDYIVPLSDQAIVLN